MHNKKCLIRWWSAPVISAMAVLLFAGCQSGKEESGGKMMTEAKPAPAAAPAIATAPVTTPAPEATSERPTIRIDAGANAPYTDSEGNVWLADQGFADGDTIDRADDLPIENTKIPAIYRTEHYGMSAFSYKLPNGKYTVKLHFAETFEGVSGPGERVFSFSVAGHEFKDFDVFAKTGGAQRAYVETVDVDVTDGKLDITFTTDIQSPEINGIEIIPAS